MHTIKIILKFVLKLAQLNTTGSKSDFSQRETQ